MTVWAVVNAVNLLQALGFASRGRHGMRVNHTVGWGIALLAIPATAAIVGFARMGSSWWVGPAAFDAFVVLMLLVDYVRPIEFREPVRLGILLPYLVLFFGSILLMGLPMFRLSVALWCVTAATTIILLVAMTGDVRGRMTAGTQATRDRR